VPGALHREPRRAQQASFLYFGQDGQWHDTGDTRRSCPRAPAGHFRDPEASDPTPSSRSPTRRSTSTSSPTSATRARSSSRPTSSPARTRSPRSIPPGRRRRSRSCRSRTRSASAPSGRDVIGAKRAIWKANGLAVPTGRDPMSFGPIAVEQLRRSSTTTTSRPTVCSARSDAPEARPVLRPVRVPALRGLRPGADPHERMRRAIVAYALWGYNQRAQIGYSEYRPMTLLGDSSISRSARTARRSRRRRTSSPAPPTRTATGPATPVRATPRRCARTAASCRSRRPSSATCRSTRGPDHVADLRRLRPRRLARLRDRAAPPRGDVPAAPRGQVVPVKAGR
jgi:hypothetical protein